jgi:DnaJ-class molecular chaperone
MDYDEAIRILELPYNYSFSQLRKSYYKKSLQFHPDKNVNGGDMFKKCKEAYDFLYELREDCNCDNDVDANNGNNGDNTVNNNTSTSNINGTSYFEMFKQYISLISDKYGWNNEVIMQVLYKIINNTGALSIKLFDDMDRETAFEIYEYLIKYKHLFAISQDTMLHLKEILERKFTNVPIYNIIPTLDDLFKANIYVLDLENNDEETKSSKPLYVPLWHSELSYDDAIIIVSPDLSDNMWLDDDNNVHICIDVVDKSDMFDESKLEVHITDDIKMYINKRYLYCRKYQTYIIKNKGIPTINTTDLFDMSHKSDIVVHIHIK